MTQQSSRDFEFGNFCFEQDRARLTRSGQEIPLAPKAAELLALLLQNPDQTLSKEFLLDKLWPSVNVTEANLSQTAYLVRKALGDTSGSQEFLQTIPRVGYRFVAEVRQPNRFVAPAPEALAEKVLPGVSEQPASRFPQFRSTLRKFTSATARVQIIVAGLIFITLIGTVVFSRRLIFSVEAEPVGPRPRSLAVLPFKNLDARAHEDNLGLGMTDVVITKLSRLKQTSVRPTSAIFKYRNVDYDALSVGRELAVDAVLDGSIQIAEDRLRLSLRLLRVSDGMAIWSAIFDEPKQELFRVQDSIALRVAETFERDLSTRERVGLAKRATDNLEAYSAYVRGLFFWSKRSPADLEKSIAYFQSAIDHDAKYSLAYAALADAYALLAISMEEQPRKEETFAKAAALVSQAKTLDPEMPEAYAAQFLIKYYHDKDASGARQELDRALALNESHVTVHVRYGFFFRDEGEIEQARQRFERVLELDPLSYVGNFEVCELNWWQRNYDKALKYCLNAIESEPSQANPRMYLAWIYSERQKSAEALELLNELEKQHWPARTFSDSLGYLYARTGQKDRAIRELRKLERYPDIFGKQVGLALIYAGLAEYEKSFKHLTAEEDRASARNLIRFDPRLDAMRADPRFKAFFDSI
jgi:DNA-binding winged helix-turn-helix (wHTH) protein/TolB-like protein